MTASVSGDISYGLMAVDGGVYFGQDQALKFRMDSTGEVTTIYQGSREMEPMGLTDKYLYFAEYTDEGQDGQVIHQMDRSDGSLQTFKFSDFCAHSDTAFCGERFFYSRGVADVGTSGVKEVDPVSGQTQVIAEDASGQLLAQGDVLYYVRAQEAGDYTQVAAELIRFLNQSFPQTLQERYGLENQADPYVCLEEIAKKRSCLAKGGQPDIPRASALLLDDFRSGRLGTITLEQPEKFGGPDEAGEKRTSREETEDGRA